MAAVAAETLALTAAATTSVDALTGLADREAFTALLDARMDEVYFAAYERQGQAWLTREPPALGRPKDVRVPPSNMLLGEGRGFEIAQGRLGPGRIHHCMRMIGVAEEALELMTRRLLSRTAFGKTLAEQSVWEERVADARIEIEMTRLLCLKAADMMDRVGNKTAQGEIAMIKVAAPRTALKMLDDAIRLHDVLRLLSFASPRIHQLIGIERRLRRIPLRMKQPRNNDGGRVRKRTRVVFLKFTPLRRVAAR